jgi:beta-lactamase regulating signal transducer with metallopeptidase domain/membrane-associated protease RseP (regulator of RpoE activity)
MSWIWTTPGGWLVRSVVGGGLLLLLTWVLMKRTRQPARRQRLGEWGVAAAVLFAILNLGPVWLPVSWLPARTATLPSTAKQTSLEAAAHQQPPSSPLASDHPRKERGASFASHTGIDGDHSASVHADVPAFELAQANEDPESIIENQGLGIENSASPTRDGKSAVPSSTYEVLESQPPLTLASTQEADGVGNFLASAILPMIWPIFCMIYSLVGVLLIGRWLLGYLALRRLLADARPTSLTARRLFAEMAGGRRRPRLLVSSRLRVPLSCGLLRPTIVLPASLIASASPMQLRWVFAHELTHVRRRDAWSCLLFGLGQGLYFFWPWFWWLRRAVRLSQEFIADAAVVRLAGPAEDYAEFLLSFTTAPAVPVGATGVMGNSSDLFRRVTMLLKSPKRMERTVSWRWTLATAGGLLALAIVASGVGPRALATPAKADVQKAPANPAPPDQDKQKDDAPKAPQPPGTPFPPGRGGFGEDQREMMQRMRQRGMMGGGFFGAHARLGVTVHAPSEALVDQLDLPKDQGLVVGQVLPDTPAAKAGLKPNDILLEFNGKPVSTNQGEFVRQVQEIKPDAKVDIVVLRKGKKETVKDLTLPEEKQPRGFGFGGGAGQGGFGGFGGGGDGNPQFPRQGFGGMGGAMAFGGPNTVMTTVTRTNERFTTRHQEGSLIITVIGTVADGTPKTNKIHVQDGQVTHDYESLDKVPEQYRDKVKNLIEMSEKGSVKIEIKTPEAKPQAKPEAKPEAK